MANRALLRKCKVIDMIGNRTQRLILTASLVITAVPLLVFCASRNHAWECCTTQAYGFPMPWYVDHCYCGKDLPAVNPLCFLFNIGLWLGTGLLLAWMAWKLKQSKEKRCHHESGRLH